jgi:hypothetical protein
LRAVLPGLEERCAVYALLPGLEERCVDFTLLPGLKERRVVFALLPGLEERRVVFALLPGLEERCVVFALLPGLEERCAVFELLHGMEERCGVFALLPGLEERRPVLSVEDSTGAAALAQHSKYLCKKVYFMNASCNEGCDKDAESVHVKQLRQEPRDKKPLSSITRIEDPDQLFSKHVSMSSAELLNRFTPLFFFDLAKPCKSLLKEKSLPECDPRV